MFIRDYLEPRQVTAAGSRLSKAVTNNSSSFQDMLKNEKTKDTQGQPAGLTISDYLNRRVTTTAHGQNIQPRRSRGSAAAPANSSE
jgi:hypothetical protein